MKQRIGLQDVAERHRELQIQGQQQELETIEVIEMASCALLMNAHQHQQQCAMLYTQVLRLKEEQENKPKIWLPGQALPRQ